jgi:hypothetical protein
MPARKGNQVFVSLLSFSKPLTQARQGMVLERDHTRHAGGSNRLAVNFLQRAFYRRAI